MNSYLSKPITFVEAPTIFCNSSKTLLIKFPYSFSRNKPSKNAFKPKLSFIKRKNVSRTASNDSTFSSSSDSVVASTIVEEEDAEATQLFEKLKDAEKQRINKLEELERKADLQLERQFVMASCWSRALLTMHGKLKGTEWDPENSHRIDFSDFMGILNSNNVQFMEYLNYGQTISVILPYYKDRKMDGTGGNSKNEIIYRHHEVYRMPINCWNDVWQKLHQQIVNVDVLNVDTVPAEVYSTVATAVM